MKKRSVKNQVIKDAKKKAEAKKVENVDNYFKQQAIMEEFKNFKVHKI